MNITIDKYKIRNKIILKDLNIKILDSKINLIIGKNGIGKTTFLNIITNLYNKYQNIKLFSYIPNNMIFPHNLNVLEYLLYFNKDLKKIINLMTYFDLEDKKIKNLSKGMIQKLLIIQTVIINRRIYLFDEIETGLDEQSIIKLKQYLINFKKTLIITTHSKEKFEDISDNICLLK